MQSHAHLYRVIHAYAEKYTATQRYTQLYKAIQAIHSYTEIYIAIRGYTQLCMAVQS